MPEAGELRYEVVDEGDTFLHVYLPGELTSGDVCLSTTSSGPGAEVAVEHFSTGKSLGLIGLEGYKLADEESAAKYSKKHRRFMIRLVRVEPAAAASAAKPPSAAAASSSPPRKGSPAPPAAAASGGSPSASTNNIFGILDNDDVSDDEGGAGEEGATGGAKKKKKKKKKGKKGGATAAGEGEAGADGEEEGEGEAATVGAPEAPAANGNGNKATAEGGGSSGDEGEPAAAGGGEGATGGAKKKKKKKKKGGAGAGAGLAAAAEEGAIGEANKTAGGDRAEVEAAEAALPERTSSIPPTPPPEAAPAPASSSASAPVSAPSSFPASAAMSKSGSRAVVVDVEADFGDEPLGKFELGRSVEHDPLLGPALHHALGKASMKGEDKWLEVPPLSRPSAFFDGHGGRTASQHAAKQLLPLVAKYAERALGPEPASDRQQLADGGYLEPGDEGSEAGEDSALARARVAAVQDALIARLPKALHAGFVECDAEVISRYKESGTTATLAVQVGWELLVANVGDSLAYLDTGAEIVAISANHRVAENPDEQERIKAKGGRIKPAAQDEDEEGPPGTATPHEGHQLRVWPSGINMTRTIGDASSDGLLLAEPAVRQISLPVTGARLFIASDGLWDAVNAKTIIGQLRTCTAREAASRAAVYAMRNKKHDDDVTVVVADFVPRPSDTHVPGLLKKANGPVATALATVAAAGLREEKAVQAWRPLETPSETWRERHRAHRRRAAAFLEGLAEAEQSEAEAAAAAERHRALAVAPAAGTAGVGTAVRAQPVSETYRELAALKVDVDE
ncbi:hypothetical protein GPECTOR_57g469 [Gonium pectorale]|uniref:PPM-type phosphatase domain-containing protein n=1 Tax=Gonium pectorale TaxID=33097 RepID=A0A150G5M0_GONPE|nr:hypothetical protein GPECTOR_57g469 [Gonium pectorale]|eukprot:KXZ45179.1 hypothetical protein GPECTOR_57g469 [Gonium pectorale]